MKYIVVTWLERGKEKRKDSLEEREFKRIKEAMKWQEAVEGIGYKSRLLIINEKEGKKYEQIRLS